MNESSEQNPWAVVITVLDQRAVDEDIIHPWEYIPRNRGSSKTQLGVRSILPRPTQLQLDNMSLKRSDSAMSLLSFKPQFVSAEEGLKNNLAAFVPLTKIVATLGPATSTPEKICL